MKLGLSSLKSLLAKDNLKTAAGVIAATSVTSLTFSKFGDKLPGLTNADGTRSAPAAIAYAVLIPGVVGILIRRYDRAISDGLIIGGLAGAALAAIQQYAPAETRNALGFSEYFTPTRSFGASITGPGAGRAFSNTRSVLASGTPFKGSNW
jgi:hypothetical protein